MFLRLSPKEGNTEPDFYQNKTRGCVWSPSGLFELAVPNPVPAGKYWNAYKFSDMKRSCDYGVVIRVIPGCLGARIVGFKTEAIVPVAFFNRINICSQRAPSQIKQVVNRFMHVFIL